MNVARVIATTLLFGLFAISGIQQAAATVTQNGAEFPRQIVLNEQPLTLSGTGIVRYRIVFIVYAAGLYLPDGTASDAVLADQTPRRLEIEYFHTISADDIILAANTKLAEQRSPEELEALQPSIDAFHALFQSVEKGDRYRMDYTPGVGTQLSFNGEPVGTVAGADFAAVYFGIWLDNQSPLSKPLRKNLLEGTMPR